MIVMTGPTQSGDEGYFQRIVVVPHKWESGQDPKAQAWRQEVIQRPERSSVSWLAFSGLLSLLLCSTQNYQPTRFTTHDETGISTSVISHKNILEAWLSHRPIRCIDFLSWNPFFQNDSSKWQAEKQNNKKQKWNQNKTPKIPSKRRCATIEKCPDLDQRSSSLLPTWPHTTIGSWPSLQFSQF